MLSIISFHLLVITHFVKNSNFESFEHLKVYKVCQSNLTPARPVPVWQAQAAGASVLQHRPGLKHRALTGHNTALHQTVKTQPETADRGSENPEPSSLCCGVFASIIIPYTCDCDHQPAPTVTLYPILWPHS